MTNRHNCHVSFHTPGHSGEAYRERGIFNYDVTELSYTDNLLSPSGAIAELNEGWRRVYGTDWARLVTSGATSAIVAALTVLEGSPLIIGDAHMSIFNTLKRQGATAVVVQDAEEGAKHLAQHSANYIIATYPDYLGRDNGIEKIHALARQYNLPLFIDSAHGAHFATSAKLPVSAAEYGDIVALSLHKTLPVCTGGALLVGKKEYEDLVGVAIRETHTTSPNFMIIESARWALEELQDSARAYDYALASIELFCEDIARDGRFSRLHNADPTRLVIDTPWDNYEVVSELEKHGIYAEGACDDGVIFIVTPYNAKYLSYLAMTLASIEELGAKPARIARDKASRVIDYCRRDYEVVPLDKAVGRALYQEIGVYPPATPMYFYGDVLTAEDVAKLKSLDSVFGLEKGSAVVLK